MFKVIIKHIRSYLFFLFEKRDNKPYPVKFFNFWPQTTDERWFYKFLLSRKVIEDKTSVSVNFFSVFGNRSTINWTNKKNINIFYTGENVRIFANGLYSDHLLSNARLDLSLGFEYLTNARYFRFPLWILYMFDPESNSEDIIKRCKELMYPDGVKERRGFASLVSRTDVNGLRKEIYESLFPLEKIDCAGSLMHNDDTLKVNYNDNKKEYLKNYRFNICPENSDQKGYVTEKIFEAIDSGCIPIYWGASNEPEPEILNQDAILFWKKCGDNTHTINMIKRLNSDPVFLSDFLKRPRLKEDASLKIISLFDELEVRIKAAIENKNC